MTKLISTLIVLLVAMPVLAQSSAELRRDLRAKETEAKEDPEAMYQVGVWANENGLDKDAARIFQKVLKANPDHEGANIALGNARFEGKWMAAEKAEELRVKALEAQYKKDGLVKVNGVWIEKDHKDDAKLGIYHHKGDLVTRDEKIALMDGKVRHPRTGELIDPADLEKAKSMFLIKGEWVAEDKANKAHRSESNPWIVRTSYCTLVGHMPIETMEEIRPHVDSAIESLLPWFGNQQPLPTHRPTVIVAEDTDAFRAFGNNFGGAGSAYGAFMSEGPVEVPNLGTFHVTCANWGQEGWKEYYAKHAAGMAYARGLALGSDCEAPLWFLRGAGSKASHLSNKGLAAYFAKQILKVGGIQAPGAFFSGFDINSEMSSNDIDRAIFQCGMMLEFAAAGGDTAATDLMLKVTEAFESRNGRAAQKALEMLEKRLRAAEAEVDAFYKDMLKG